ncbi:hypothetical protein MBAV_003410 [Candidatus Magnetobacterium bavaricum]|uniref:Uncharacterized protein n=1 Tax=Candidatus Magnetobacterium bavaricum TaxID=29290 RepID=A0A0F3GRK6_9BACT|nr:hypothetical protein MBAV_003410 [Candidatus Magnetobacterium bavaricum]
MFRRNDSYIPFSTCDSYIRFPSVPVPGSNRGHSWLDQESRMRKSIVTMKYEDTEKRDLLPIKKFFLSIFL